MKITDALLGEHGVFQAQLAHLEQVGPSSAEVASLKTQAALLAAALATHAQLEEELLFRALDPHLGGMGPLAVMRSEHQEIEDTLGQLQGLEDLVKSRQQMMHVVHVARQHFAKEEQILFGLADQALGGEALSNLGSQWAERRGVMI